MANIHDSSDLTLKAFKCQDCDIPFHARQFYITHFKKVHGTFPPEFADKTKFFCDQCPDAFLSNDRLKTHVWTKHRIDKKNEKIKVRRSFECKHCQKSYTTLCNLQEHVLKIHEKNTPFKCQQCNSKFGLQHVLNTHMKIVHSKVNCDLCGQRIYNSFELKRHKAEVHGIVPSDAIQCDQCPLIFKSKANLQRHMSSKHS